MCPRRHPSGLPHRISVVPPLSSRLRSLGFSNGGSPLSGKHKMTLEQAIFPWSLPFLLRDRASPGPRMGCSAAAVSCHLELPLGSAALRCVYLVLHGVMHYYYCTLQHRTVHWASAASWSSRLWRGRWRRPIRAPPPAVVADERKSFASPQRRR